MLDPYPEPRSWEHSMCSSINMFIKNNLLHIDQLILHQKSKLNFSISLGGILPVCFPSVLLRVIKTHRVKNPQRLHLHCFVFDLPGFFVFLVVSKSVEIGSVPIWFAKTEFDLGRRRIKEFGTGIGQCATRICLHFERVQLIDESESIGPDQSPLQLTVGVRTGEEDTFARELSILVCTPRAG